MNVPFRAVTLLCLIAGITACSNEEQSTSGNGIPVNVNAGIKTRAVDNQWTAGDAIGLTMLQSGTTDIAEEALNRRYTTATGDGSFTADAANAIYYPKDGSSTDFLAYYPYKDDVKADLVLPVDVSTQTFLPAIDLLTADRFSGASKNNADVALNFKHRLCKVIFNLHLEDNTQKDKVKSLVISGMKTTGTYALATQSLTIEPDAALIGIPVVNNQNGTAKAVGIVMPRDKSEGVIFEITLENNTRYKVAMSSEQILEAGTKNTFNITLRDKQTPPVVSAVITDWIEGTDDNYVLTAVTIAAKPGMTTGFVATDQITLYTGTTQLSKLTYNGTIWDAAPGIYWENMTDGVSKTVDFTALYTRSTAPQNSNQMDEILLAATTAERYNSVELPFKHASSKILIELTSTGTEGQTFTADELKAASVVLPDYTIGYSVANGIFTDDKNIRGEVKVTDRNQTLVVPQSIGKGDNLCTVTLYGKGYTATASEALTFEAGKVNKLTVNVTKTRTSSLSATLTDWDITVAETQGNAIVVTTPGTTTGFNTGNRIDVYATTTESTPEAVSIGAFTYSQEKLSWIQSGEALTYWENIPGTGKLTMSAIHTPAFAPANSNQTDDVMLAQATDVNRFGNIQLDFTKATAKIIVKLTSPPTGGFTVAELAKASITLPAYLTGATFAHALYTPGTKAADIHLTQQGSEVEWRGLIQPQTLTKGGNTYIRVALGEGQYLAKTLSDNDITFLAGKAYTFVISIKKLEIGSISATYTSWDESGPATDIETDLDK